MSTERDTHFYEFARMHYPELATLFSRMYAAWAMGEEEQARAIVLEIKTLIAQHAYDLVYQSIEFMRQAPQNWPSMELSGTETWVHFIPDLTEWPAAKGQSDE